MIFNKLKFFFHLFKQYFLKKKKLRRKKTQMALEDDLYSLDGYQLNNLLDKNIYFDFFQLDSLKGEINDELKKPLQKAELKTNEEILSQLKAEDFKKPIVLVCRTGKSSKALSQELRAKGFVNVYFMKKGFQSLIEDF